jgi:beta-glucosidase
MMSHDADPLMSRPRYRRPDAPLDERIEDLLGRMTVEEKGAQLDMLDRSWGEGESYVRNGRFDHDTAAANITPHGQGSLSQRADAASARSYAESSNAVQRFLAEHTRLGIPALFISETLHGLVGPVGTTVFPQAIGLGATWNPELAEQIGEVISGEARAVGSHVGLSPVLDVCRDPRWGRLEETFGEDPHLVARMGVAMVRGLQGREAAAPRLIATPKHFAGHGAPQGGRDSAPAGYGREYLREFALPPFEAAVREADAGAMMAAYSDWCYVPCNASHELLTEILRDEWEFDGFVIEDMGAISLLKESHSVAIDAGDAARMAVRAGVDQSFASEFGRHVAAAVTDGLIAGEILDRAVRRILRAKFLLGLFEDPYVDVRAAMAACDTPDHRALAREAARQSVVLLKNDDGTLPLRTDLRTVAVVGPNADVAECGDYSGKNARLVTPLDGIRAAVSSATKVLYARGCEVSDGLLGRPTVIDTKFLTPSGTVRGFAPQPGATGLMGEYFDSLDHAGVPAVSRVDQHVLLGEDPRSVVLESMLVPNRLSVRWSGVLVAEVDGSFDLTVTATDGVRLRLAGELVISAWGDGPRRTHTAPVTLAANEPVPLVLEWYSCSPSPHVELMWSRSQQGEGGVEEAVEAVRQAEVGIVCVGGSGATSGEIRDAADLDLTGRQLELIRAVHETGTPVVLIHIGGRPNTMEWAFDHVAAAVAAWNPGEEGGNAIADVLFGEVNPSGKLPIQWPATTAQLPSTYDYMHTGRNERGSYVNGPVEPRYPFGHGLSYTQFEYGPVQAPSRVPSGNDVTISVDVSNVGARDGVEVVQLYLRDLVASVKRPMRQLKGFERVALRAGETKTVTFALKPVDFSLRNAEGEQVVEPGEFAVMLGGSCVTTRAATVIVE